MLYRHIEDLNNPRGIINSRDGVFLDSQLAYGRHIDNLTEKRNQRLHVCTQIRSHLTHTVSETYLLAIILSVTPCCLPLWSATTKDLIEPAAGLHNKELVRFMAAFSTLGLITALSQYSSLNSCAIKFYEQIHNNSWSPAPTALRPRCRSLLDHCHCGSQCQLTENSCGQALFFWNPE